MHIYKKRSSESNICIVNERVNGVGLYNHDYDMTLMWASEPTYCIQNNVNVNIMSVGKVKL